MELLYTLLVLLAVTRGFGECAERLQQPALVGELLAGVLLGFLVARFAGTFPILAGLPDDEVFAAITDLGIFFLMLLGGVELKPRQLAEASRGAIWVALAGFALPLALGFGLATAFLPESPVKFAQSLFIGTALAITAVPVAIKVLMDLDRLDSKVGQMIVSAAVFDDVLSLMLLAVLVATIKTGELPDPVSLALLGGQIVVFFAVAIALGLFVMPRLGRLARSAKIHEFELSVLLIAALAYAVLAEALGLHFILGAFLAGLFFRRGSISPEAYEIVQSRISGITTGFLAPVFFASIGMHLDLSAVGTIPLFLALLIGAAFLGKLVGCGICARAGGMTRREALGVGAGMSGRGAVELILADIALRAGLFSTPDPTPPVVANLFSAVVIVAVVTTIVTPVTLRWALGERPG